MSKEGPNLNHPNKSPEEEFESQKFVPQSLEDMNESNEAYLWFENYAIQHREAIEIKVSESGLESAQIRGVDPKTKQEGIIYYTEKPKEVASLKSIKEGKTIVADVSIEDIAKEKLLEESDDSSSEDY